MEDNILSVLGIQDKEDVISNLLEYCINSSPGFAKLFVTRINNGLSVPWGDIKAHTKKSA